jgi:transcriptional regulator with XRE-family HTH domain
MSDSDAEQVQRIGRAIAERRRVLQLSQAVVAERLGMVSPESLSRYERGEREPRCTTLARIALALETKPSELMKALDPAPRGSLNRVERDERYADDLRSIDTHLALLSRLEPSALPAVRALVEKLVETLPLRTTG